MQTAPPTAKPRDDVKFCAVQRVGAHAFLVVCTALRWQVFRLDRFSSSRDSLTPVQIVVDDTHADAVLTNIRMLRLFRLPGTDSSRVALGGLFVSERCDEVDYSHASADTNDTNDTNDANEWQSASQHADDLTVFSFPDERIVRRLPPPPSTVVDVQIERSTAAVLCESHEIFLIDLLTFNIRQRITSLASLAMALGPRWIAYPECASSAFDEDSDREDADEVVLEALVHNTSRQLLASTTSTSTSSTSSAAVPIGSYNAIDVAQNVASGIYYLSKTIAPYLSSSPTATNDKASSTPSATDPSTQRPPQQPVHSGWVTVQDVHTTRVVASFQCHSTALVHLAFDPSGSLLATSSTKGQNVHVYRLLPPLQYSRGRRPLRHQLLYKLQRGITHASIADVAFSQDAKWLSVTSAHGTSHLYAIHPEGMPMSLHSHATVHTSHREDHYNVGSKDVSDFCAGLRPVEPKTLSRVLKIHHSLLAKNHTRAAAALTASTASTSYGSFGLGASSAFYYNTPPSTLVGNALDASQALIAQLAQSTGLDFGGYEDVDGPGSWRRHRRHRLCCLFAVDGLKMVICCDNTLKLYDLSVHTPLPPSTPSGTSAKHKTRSSPFGFDATVAELKSWDLLEMDRVRTESLASTSADDAASSDAAAPSPHRPRTSELRTFVPRGLPLWAHPKVSFRVVEPDHPDGLVLQVKRKGPSAQEFGGDGIVHGDGDDQQLFVMEMDAYFGLGGSPVFTGQSDQRVTPAVPRLDLAESMNLAIATSIATPTDATSSLSTTPEPTHIDDGLQILKLEAKTDLTKKTHGRPPRETVESSSSPSSESSSLSTSASTSPTILQFTLQHMYFAQPPEPST